MFQSYPLMMTCLLAGIVTSQAQAQDCIPLTSDVDGASAIRMSQHGFELDGRKFAILRTSHATPVVWQLVDDNDQTVMTGQSRVHGPNATSADHVHQIDFSAIETAGSGYRIKACNSQSRPFRIDEDLWSEVSVDSLSYFYHNRLGIDLDPAYLQGQQWQRNAGFDETALTCFSGQDKHGQTWPACDYTLDVSGGWADAGDYGKYVVNGGISVWTLQYAYERLQNIHSEQSHRWRDGRISLPENGNDVSDILDEARWQLEFMLAMQVPEGESVAIAHGTSDDADSGELVIDVIDGSGLVHHKVHERAWLALPILPEDSEAERLLVPPSTAATLNLAATAAQAARLWFPHDPEFSERALEAARRAYSAARRHPDIYAHDTFDGGGAYGDTRIEDEFFWAATELYLTTGDPAYWQDMTNDTDRFTASDGDISWSNTDPLPALSLILHPDKVPQPVQGAVERQILNMAERYLHDRDHEGYAFPIAPEAFQWGSSGNAANRALVLAAAHDLTGEAPYRGAVLDVMDYLLGRNALDQSYVSGYGARAMRHPHHRFWAEGVDPDYPPVPRGALSGGPNAYNMADPVAQSMRGQCVEQTCWVDDYRAYALNEVAINWNAPLFAVSVFLETTQ